MSAVSEQLSPDRVRIEDRGTPASAFTTMSPGAEIVGSWCPAQIVWTSLDRCRRRGGGQMRGIVKLLGQLPG
jgi:hypothetical protein